MRTTVCLALALLIASSPVLATQQAPASVGRPDQRFGKVGMMVPNGDKTKEVDVILIFGSDGLAIEKKDDDPTPPLKTFPYASITSGEYSYSKSPRWKSAIFLTVFALFTSGKKHWLMVKTTDDYAVLHLDKNNYRMVIGEIEARSRIKVETVADSK